MNYNKQQDEIIENIKKFLSIFSDLPIRRYTSLLIAFLIIVFLASGIHQIEEGEKGVVLRFGKLVRIEHPGLCYKLPYPIEKVHIGNVQKSRQIEIGFGSDRKWNAVHDILTRDENLINLKCVVTWHIKDVVQFLIKVQDPEQVVNKISQSVIREIIGDSTISDVLSNKKEEIARKMQSLIQKISDRYESGIYIEKVSLLAVEPPDEVIPAYRDVQSARADKENKINEANAYRNSVVTEAEGEAKKMVKESQSFSYYLISKAEGDVEYFRALLRAYNDNQSVTKNRMLLDCLDEVLKDKKKIILDSEKTIPHFSLQKLMGKKN